MNKKWNSRVKCTYASVLDPHHFTMGLIYVIRDGRIIDDSGSPSWCTYTDIESLNGAFYASFVEV